MSCLDQASKEQDIVEIKVWLTMNFPWETFKSKSENPYV